ncbi:MAG: SGNH/GDSL hydrolase family protein [Elusimicrobia bacterium]|nr:SGNH/GDSL hydrolase family protein [Elusimicrobiota bacterium]
MGRAIALCLLGLLASSCAPDRGIPVRRESGYLSPSGILRFHPDSVQLSGSENPAWPGELTHLNNEGFRGPPWRSGRAVVMVLGDSYVFGNGLKDSETLDRRLELGLRKEGLNARVWNLGIPGYNLESSLILAAEMIDRFHPAVVVCHFLNEDDLVYFDISRLLSFELEHPRWSRLMKALGLDLYRLERRFFTRFHNKSRLRGILERMVLGPALPRKTRLLFHLQDGRFREVFASLGLEAITDPEPRPCDPDRCFIPEDGHPTAELIELRAQRLREHLRASLGNLVRGR